MAISRWALFWLEMAFGSFQLTIILIILTLPVPPIGPSRICRPVCIASLAAAAGLKELGWRCCFYVGLGALLTWKPVSFSCREYFAGSGRPARRSGWLVVFISWIARAWVWSSDRRSSFTEFSQADSVVIVVPVRVVALIHHDIKLKGVDRLVPGCTMRQFCFAAGARLPLPHTFLPTG